MVWLPIFVMPVGDNIYAPPYQNGSPFFAILGFMHMYWLKLQNDGESWMNSTISANFSVSGFIVIPATNQLIPVPSPPVYVGGAILPDQSVDLYIFFFTGTSDGFVYAVADPYYDCVHLRWP